MTISALNAVLDCGRLGMRLSKTKGRFPRFLRAETQTWTGLILGLCVLISALGWAPPPQDDGTTEDPSDIEIAQLHLFAVVSGDRLVIREGYSISNLGEQTYVGSEDPETGERVTLTFFLPDGAENLSFEESGLGERFIEVEGGFADTQPIPPGNAVDETGFGVAFVYELPLSVGMQIERVFPAPVSSAVLLLLDDETILQGPSLFAAGGVETQMGVALSYIANPIALGDSLVFAIVERPPEMVESIAQMDTGVQSPIVRNTTTEVGIGFVTLACAAVGAYLLYRPTDAGPIPARVRSLVDDIVRLDRAYEDGGIEDGMYHDDRERLFHKIRSKLE
jgi:hypothetical protein